MSMTTMSDEKPEAVDPANTPALQSGEPAKLLSAAAAGQMCCRSTASWWRDHAAGRIPAPITLGGRTLWRRDELDRWIAASCPPRRLWEAREAARCAAKR